MSKPQDLFAGVERAFYAAKEIAGEGRCLWPSPYNTGDYESRLAFVYDCCWTWNEADRACMKLPKKAYIDYFVWEWTDTKAKGQPFICLKSRRLIISWLCRALELHDAGLSQANQLIAGQTFADAQAHVWRCWYLFDQCQKRNPNWKLDDPLFYGPMNDGRLDSLILPNGSKISSINQRGESFRGTGVTGACCEEGSAYDRLSNTWGQAVTVCQGSPTSVGGHPTMIANASPNEEFLELIAA